MISNRNRRHRWKKTIAAGVLFLFLFNGLSWLTAEEANLPEKAGAYTEDALVTNSMTDSIDAQANKKSHKRI